jgi:hypothetical protein
MGYGTLLRLDTAVTTSAELFREGSIIHVDSRTTIQAKAVLTPRY